MNYHQLLIADISGIPPLMIFVCVAVAIVGVIAIFAFRKSGAMGNGGTSVSSFNDPAMYDNSVIDTTTLFDPGTPAPEPVTPPTPAEAPQYDLGPNYQPTFDPSPMTEPTIDFTPSDMSIDVSAPTDSSSGF